MEHHPNDKEWDPGDTSRDNSDQSLNVDINEDQTTTSIYT